jgi:hypothetical protein
MKPCPNILIACQQRYGEFPIDKVPPAYIYLIMVETSYLYTMHGRLGGLFRRLLGSHLRRDEIMGTEMGRLIQIALRLQMEFTIPSDILDRGTYTINIENAMYETVVLENLQPVSRSSTWMVAFSFPDFRPRRFVIGSLEELCSILRLI